MSIYIKNQAFKNSLLISIDASKKVSKTLDFDAFSLLFAENTLVGVNFFEVHNDLLKKFNFSYGSLTEELRGTLNSLISEQIKGQPEYLIPQKINYLSAQIIDIKKHENSNNLDFVTLKADQEYEVVTNLKGLKIGDNVTVATLGTLLATAKVVGYEKIANHFSKVMLVSEKTMKISDDLKPYSSNLENGKEILFTWKI
ncbi:hypothetical protein [Mycoplasmopsis agassizii]|nr:hypothetical protein [Mycoplasmopsis agassizii]SMC15789.1 Putative tRNA binding domain-containing protein [Mycoplasmopsis agassizii]